ncbi:MAG: hypothetical protein LBR82_04045 [Desulfovibrio sp.]|nr:hypothetical protein [Desulfovibrio sp.]
MPETRSITPYVEAFTGYLNACGLKYSHDLPDEFKVEIPDVWTSQGRHPRDTAYSFFFALDDRYPNVLGGMEVEEGWITVKIYPSLKSRYREQPGEVYLAASRITEDAGYEEDVRTGRSLDPEQYSEAHLRWEKGEPYIVAHSYEDLSRCPVEEDEEGVLDAAAMV